MLSATIAENAIPLIVSITRVPKWQENTRAHIQQQKVPRPGDESPHAWHHADEGCEQRHGCDGHRVRLQQSLVSMPSNQQDSTAPEPRAFSDRVRNLTGSDVTDRLTSTSCSPKIY